MALSTGLSFRFFSSSLQRIPGLSSFEVMASRCGKPVDNLIRFLLFGIMNA